MIFVIKSMISQDFRWNSKTMEKCEPHLVNPCGSDHTMIIRDLKTLRGLLNRVKGLKFSKNTVEVHICTSINPVGNDEKVVKILKQGEFNQ